MSDPDLIIDAGQNLILLDSNVPGPQGPTGPQGPIGPPGQMTGPVSSVIGQLAVFANTVGSVLNAVTMSGGASMTAAGVVTLALFTATLPGAVPASGGGTVNFLRADGTWAVAGAAPAGVATELQYRGSANALGAVAGSAVSANGSLTLGGASLTVNDPVLNLAQTWNAPAIATTGASGTGVTATITFAAQPAAYPVGSLITVSGVTPTAYNGTFTVTASSTTSVSYASTATGAQTIAGTIQQLFVGLKANYTSTASATYSRLVQLQVNSSDIFSITKEGYTVVGPGAASGPQTFETSNALIQTISDNIPWGVVQFTYGNQLGIAGTVWAKTRGANITSQVIVQNGDRLVDIVGAGSDGVQFQRAGVYRIEVDAVPGLNDVPGRHSWRVHVPGSGSATTTEVMRLDSGGRLVIGGVAAQAFPDLFAFQLHGTTFAAAGMGAARWSNDAGVSSFTFAKSRGATIGTQAIVAVNDVVGRWQFRGSDGTQFQDTATIEVAVDGTPGAASMPGRIIFKTSPFNSATVTTRATIDSFGTLNVGLGNTTPVFAPLLNLQQVWNGPAIATTGASGTGAVATITFAAQAVPYPVGSSIVVSGVTPVGYNGTYVVTASTTTSVSYANTTIGAQTVAGTVQQIFTGAVLNITNTASAAGSLLADLRVANASVLTIDPTGTIIGGPVGGANAGIITLLGASPGFAAGVYLGRADDTAKIFWAGSNGGRGAGVGSDGTIGFAAVASGNTLSVASFDVRLYRDGPGILAQRNGVNPQVKRIYNSFTDASNGEWLEANWSANTMFLRTFANGTGVVRAINFSASQFDISASASYILLYANGVATQYVATDGSIPASQGVFNLGRTSLRWATLFGGGNTVTASTPTLDIAQTWNNAATTFVGANLNFTNTASANGSKFLNIQVGGVTKVGFGYDQAGQIWINSPYITGPTGTWAQSINFNPGGNDVAIVATGGSVILAGALLDFASGSNALRASYVQAASGVLHLWKPGSASTTPLGIFLYNSQDGLGVTPTNYERAVLDWTISANTFTIGTQAGGTGLARNVNLLAGGGTYTFSSNQILASAALLLTANGGQVLITGAFGDTQFQNNISPRNNGTLSVGSPGDSWGAGFFGGNTVAVNAPILNLAQTWNGTTIATTGASGTGTVATITFAAQAAAFPVGSRVVVSGVTPAGYNGTYIVTASTTTSVSYASTTTGAQTIAGTVQQAFTGLQLNVTNTASALGSTLIDLQVAGSSKLILTPTGMLQTGGGANAPSSGIGTAFIRTDNSGRGSAGNGAVAIYYQAGDATPRAWIGVDGISITNQNPISWASSAIDATAAADLLLWRGGPNVLALANGANTQKLSVYNLVDDPRAAVNYERASIFYGTTAGLTNVLIFGNEFGGTGVIRNMQIGPFGQQLVFMAGGGSWAGKMWNTSVLTLGGADDLGLGRSVGGVLDVNLGANSATKDGWINYGGQKRVATDFSVTNSVALVNVTGLSVNCQAGRSYSFSVWLDCTDAAAGGVKAAINGTATVTDLRYTGYLVDTNAIKGQAEGTAMGATVASSTTTATTGLIILINGTFTCLAAGTLTVQFAQNTSNATASVVKRGSYFIVDDMP